MTIRKYADGEGKLEVLRGREANALNDHMQRLGKFSVSAFSDEEREALLADLDVAREADEKEANEQRKNEASDASDDVSGEGAGTRSPAPRRTPRSRADAS